MSQPSSIKPSTIELKPAPPNMDTNVSSDTKNKEKPKIETVALDTSGANEEPKSKDVPSEEPKSKDIPSEEPKLKDIPNRVEGDGGNDLGVNEPGITTNSIPLDYWWGGSERAIPDINYYQQKQTLGKGMMDLALFSANANQLRYVLECADRHPYYYPSMILIIFSLICQVGVGLALLWNSMYNINIKLDMNKANKANNYTVIGIFLVTVVNVFISAFGVANPPPLPIPAGGTTTTTTAMALISGNL